MQIRTAALSGRASVPPLEAVPSDPADGAPVTLCVWAPADPIETLMPVTAEAVEKLGAPELLPAKAGPFPLSAAEAEGFV